MLAGILKRLIKKSHMKTLIIILFLTISTCFGQRATEENWQNIIRKWEFKEFQDTKKNKNVITVTLVKYAENVTFEFKKDRTLEVIYSTSKTETYLWKFTQDLLEITSENYQSVNSDILGVFEIYNLESISQIFLQRKNDPHHGIVLKK